MSRLQSVAIILGLAALGLVPGTPLTAAPYTVTISDGACQVSTTISLEEAEDFERDLASMVAMVNTCTNLVDKQGVNSIEDTARTLGQTLRGLEKGLQEGLGQGN